MTASFARSHLIRPILFVAAAVVMALQTVVAAPVVHVLGIYCDGYKGANAAINEGVQFDRRTVTSFFSENVYAQAWGIELKTREVAGELATLASIQQAYEQVAALVKPEDTIFIYFSGHGAVDKASGQQILLTCDEKMLNRDEWAEKINQLNCRLKVLVTDACSTYLDKEIAEGDEELLPWNSVYHLLLRHKGFVNLTAASPGEAAFCTKVGSFFTVNLFSDMQRYPAWTEVFKEASTRTAEETKEAANVQNPLAHSLGEKLEGGGAGPAAQVKPPAFVIPDSHTRLLTRAELQTMGLTQLYLARNEIWARKGQAFKTPMLQKYFGAQPWYVPRGAGDASLSALESKNSDLIKEVERSKGGPLLGAQPPPPGELGNVTSAPDIFPYSSRVLLTRPAVESLSKVNLSLARNEIWARYGFPFQSKALQNYFAKKPGYQRNPRMTDPKFNSIERQNLWLIEKIERIRGGAHKWN